MELSQWQAASRLDYSVGEFGVLDLGLIDYEAAFCLQQEIVRDIFLGSRQSVLLLCEHYPVITLGRLADKRNILRPQEEIKAKGIAIRQINRGGDATLHLPGQLVVYPIFDLRTIGRDIGRFLRNLEKTAILLLQDYDIAAYSKPNSAGVWVNDKKIASIGIALSRWITYHGMSLNINCNLNFFSLIRPCGKGIMMTSMAIEKTGSTLDINEIKSRIVDKFCEVFSLKEVK
jgi:lipoate-protein ligase B